VDHDRGDVRDAEHFVCELLDDEDRTSSAAIRFTTS